MTEGPASPATRVRRDLSVDQKHALKTAATRLHTEFGEHFGVETIERFLHSSYDQLLPGIERADDGVIECADDRGVGTAPLGVVSGAVVGSVTAWPSD